MESTRQQHTNSADSTQPTRVGVARKQEAGLRRKPAGKIECHREYRELIILEIKKKKKRTWLANGTHTTSSRKALPANRHGAKVGSAQA